MFLCMQFDEDWKMKNQLYWNSSTRDMQEKKSQKTCYSIASGHKTERIPKAENVLTQTNHINKTAKKNH